MRVFIRLFLMFLFGAMAGGTAFGSRSILPFRGSSAQDTIVIAVSNPGQAERPAVYDLKRWIVEEKTDPVQHALEVYKKKSTPRYSTRVWITDKGNGTKRLLVEYISRGAGDKIFVSPDEDFLYYLGIAPAGESLVYGVNLLTQRKFLVGAGDDFRTVNCSGNKSYVVVWQGSGRKAYQVYASSGKRMKTLTNIESPVDLEENLCR